jgi:hypothetical protein
MKRLSSLYAFCILLFFISCERDLETDISITEQLCFNCILNPDSTIRATLSLSRSISQNKIFAKINNAQVLLKKDGEFFGQLKNTGDGIYSLNTKPTEKGFYEISVDALGFKKLFAKTIIPERATASFQLNDPIIHNKNPPEVYYSYTNQITINDKYEQDYYWIYRISKHPSFGLILSSISVVDSQLIDDFNKVTDATIPLGYFYDFFYLRINSNYDEGKSFSFRINSYDNDMIFILDTDEHYDKYLKSTIKQKMNAGDNLIFNEPVQIYSNIENGLGIFGSVAITKFKL